MSDLPPPASGCDACGAQDAAIAELGQQVGELQATVARGREHTVARLPGVPDAAVSIGRACAPWRYTCWCSSTCPSSGAGS